MGKKAGKKLERGCSACGQSYERAALFACNVCGAPRTRVQGRVILELAEEERAANRKRKTDDACAAEERIGDIVNGFSIRTGVSIDSVRAFAKEVADVAQTASVALLTKEMGETVRSHLDAERHHVRVLGQALGRMLVHVGAVNANMGATGPELLCAAETYMEAPPSPLHVVPDEAMRAFALKYATHNVACRVSGTTLPINLCDCGFADAWRVLEERTQAEHHSGDVEPIRQRHRSAAFPEIETRAHCDRGTLLAVRAAPIAEIEMLRGVGCSEDDDGSCGACIKCALAGKHVRSTPLHAAKERVVRAAVRRDKALEIYAKTSAADDAQSEADAYEDADAELDASVAALRALESLEGRSERDAKD